VIDALEAEYPGFHLTAAHVAEQAGAAGGSASRSRAAGHGPFLVAGGHGLSLQHVYAVMHAWSAARLHKAGVPGVAAAECGHAHGSICTHGHGHEHDGHAHTHVGHGHEGHGHGHGHGHAHSQHDGGAAVGTPAADVHGQAHGRLVALMRGWKRGLMVELHACADGRVSLADETRRAEVAGADVTTLLAEAELLALEGVMATAAVRATLAATLWAAQPMSPEAPLPMLVPPGLASCAAQVAASWQALAGLGAALAVRCAPLGTASPITVAADLSLRCLERVPADSTAAEWVATTVLALHHSKEGEEGEEEVEGEELGRLTRARAHVALARAACRRRKWADARSHAETASTLAAGVGGGDGVTVIAAARGLVTEVRAMADGVS
jgi:hypothetical protein